jgi:hypothetical protein
MSNTHVDNGPMLNAYPDSMGATLSDIIKVLSKPEFKDVFQSFYILPSIYNTDLDRGFSVIDYGINKELGSREDLDRLEDLLNFAPTGVIELAKDLAVNLQIPDTRKRALISKKTGFNVDKAIEIKVTCAPEETAVSAPAKPERKATAESAKTETPSAPTRKVVIKK